MKRLAALLAAALLLSACGGGDDEVTEEEAADVLFGDVPACSDYFGTDKPLPEDFEGCQEGDEIPAFGFFDDCVDGRTFVSGPPGWGFLGEVATPTPKGQDEPDVDSKEYKADFNACYK